LQVVDHAVVLVGVLVGDPLHGAAVPLPVLVAVSAPAVAELDEVGEVGVVTVALLHDADPADEAVRAAPVVVQDADLVADLDGYGLDEGNLVRVAVHHVAGPVDLQRVPLAGGEERTGLYGVGGPEPGLHLVADDELRLLGDGGEVALSLQLLRFTDPD